MWLGPARLTYDLDRVHQGSWREDARVESPEPHLVLPQLRLDDLLSELQSRVQAVRDTRDRVRGLLEAVIAVGSNLRLEAVLRRIVEAAVTLVDARYGALGVIDQDGRLADFIPVGLDEAAIARIDHWPEGRGLLGLLITDPRPLRLADIASHPQSSGFPDWASSDEVVPGRADPDPR